MPLQSFFLLPMPHAKILSLCTDSIEVVLIRLTLCSLKKYFSPKETDPGLESADLLKLSSIQPKHGLDLVLGFSNGLCCILTLCFVVEYTVV